MAVYLRISATKRAAESLRSAWPFARRPPIEATLSVRPRLRGVGINVRLSDRGFDDFSGQLADTKRFLRRYPEPLAALIATRGVSSAGLDFGVIDKIDGGRGPAAAQFFRLPADLIALAGRLGLGLELSIYPAEALGTKRRPIRKAARRGAVR